MIRVLHVSQPTDGGVAGYLATAATDQAARGWDVTVGCPDHGWLPGELAARGVPHRVWRAVRAPGRSVWEEARGLSRLLRELRPDVLHLHSAKAGLAGRLAARGRVPTVFQPHGWSWLAVDGPLRMAALGWERAAARWAHTLVCVGAGEAEDGHRRGLGANVVVVRNGVDPRRYPAADDAARSAARRLLGLDVDAPLVLCPGRVTRQKGQDVLLAAWPQVRQRCPTAGLVVLGDGEWAAPLAARAPERVRFVPAVTDVRPWYAAADVVALPSRWEGLSLTVLEAMSSGRCVVGSAVPGLAEVVAPGTGVVVPAEDPAALAEALATRLEQPDRARAEGAAAARHAAGFDVGHTLDRLAAVTVDAARSSTTGLARWAYPPGLSPGGPSGVTPNNSRNTAEDSGFSSHCQTPWGQ